MNALKRTKNSLGLLNKSQGKIFSRDRDLLPVEIFYTEGVEMIVKYHKFLEIKDDTVFMAIDIYRNYMKKGGPVAHATIVPICISCLILSSKIN